jgi:hypothetical protein
LDLEQEIKTSVPWTQAEIDHAVRAATVEGKTNAQIATEIDRSPDAIRRKLVKLGSRKRNSKWTEEKEAILRRGVAEGRNALSISLELGDGLTPNAVEMKAIRLRLWEPKQKLWPAHEIAKLRELAAEGLPTREIGERLGRTKNMVIGACHRYGVQLTKQHKGRQPKTRTSSSFNVFVKRPSVRPALPVKMRPASGLDRDHVPLLSLKPQHCRWVEKTSRETKDGIALFCGRRKQPGSSYCPDHAEYLARD